MITVLAGGVGAARFLQGLVAVHSPSDVTIISNVADDAEFFGLHVSPDIDIVLYHLAGIANEGQGFGIRDDTCNVLETLSGFGYDTWFRLGDRDLATCLTRTDLLRRGRTLSEATQDIAHALGVPARVLPATEDSLRTKIMIDGALIDFQDFFVKRGAREAMYDVVFQGLDSARPAPGVLDAIFQAETVILAPSNPVVSIGPIIAMRGMRQMLRETRAPVIAVSPIVGGSAIRGPAAQMMKQQGLEASAVGVALTYQDFLDVLVIDTRDEDLKPEIESLGLGVVVTDTIMSSQERKSNLASVALKAAATRRSGQSR